MRSSSDLAYRRRLERLTIAILRFARSRMAARHPFYGHTWTAIHLTVGYRGKARPAAVALAGMVLVVVVLRT